MALRAKILSVTDTGCSLERGAARAHGVGRWCDALKVERVDLRLRWLGNVDQWPAYGRKLFVLSLLTGLLLLPNFVIPRVGTQNPAIHSKELMSRFLVAWLTGVFFLGCWRSRIRDLSFVEIGMLGFVVANLLSCIMSSHPIFCLGESWHLWGFALLAGAVALVNLNLKERQQIILVAVGAAIIAAAYGFCVYWGFDFLRPYYPFAYAKGDARNYVHSFLGNPEYFGSYMAAVGILAFGHILRPNSRWLERTGWTILCLFFLLAIVLSGTRSAFLAFAVGAGLMLKRTTALLSPSHRRYALLGLVGFLVLAATVVAVLSFPNPLNVRRMRLAQRFVQVFDLTSPSVRERILFYTISGRLIREYPVFGVGPGAFKLYFYPTVEKLVEEDPRAGFRRFAETLQGRIAEHAHNDYLEIWSETGSLGIGMFLFFIALLLVRYVRGTNSICATMKWGTAGSSNLAWLMFQRDLFFATLLAILMNSFFSFPLHLPVRAFLFWVCVGCFLAADRELQERTLSVQQSSASTWASD